MKWHIEILKDFQRVAGALYVLFDQAANTEAFQKHNLYAIGEMLAEYEQKYEWFADRLPSADAFLDESQEWQDKVMEVVYAALELPDLGQHPELKAALDEIYGEEEEIEEDDEG